MKFHELDYAVRAAVHRLGRVGGLGLALLAGTAVFHFSAVRPAQEELATLERRAAEVGQRGPAGPAAATSDESERFIGFFPAVESTPRSTVSSPTRRVFPLGPFCLSLLLS